MGSVPKTAVHLLVEGRVQGVGFRFFAQDAAAALGLSGWVRNLPTGAVESYAAGAKADLETYIAKLRQGPSLARVERVQVSWQAPQESLQDFSIR